MQKLENNMAIEAEAIKAMDEMNIENGEPSLQKMRSVHPTKTESD